MASQDGRGAVELFGEYEAGQSMGEREWSERKQQMRALPRLIGPSAWRADREDNTRNAVVALPAEPGGECLGGVRLSPAVEQDHGGSATRLALDPVKETAFGPESRGVARREPGQPREIALSQFLERIAGWKPGSDVGEGKIHRGRISIAPVDSPKTKGINGF